MIALLARLRRRRKSVPIAVTVYCRKECSCCDKAITVLEKFARKYNLQIESIDVDTDPKLVEAYGLSVPVVAIDGKVRFKGVVNPVLLKRLLDANEK